MSDTQPTGILVTPEHRVLFPNLFEAKAFMRNGKPQGDPKYGYTMLFDPQDVEDIRKIAGQVAKEKWPGRDLKELKFPWTNGDNYKARMEKEKPGRDYGFYEGKVIIKATSKFKPGVVDGDAQDILDQSKVYSGCYAFAEINLVAYDGVGSNPDGVTAYVNFVMKSRDGERIAGRTAQDVFKGVKGQTTSEDPTDGLDDEIPW